MGRQAAAAQKQAAEAEERRQQNEAAKSDMKVAKKVNKKKVQEAGKKGDDDDDFDALLDEFATKDCICHFGPCKVKVNTLMDMISKCQYCSYRFCLTHAQAEAHGCGDAAHRAGQKQFKQDADGSLNPRGAGLTGKSCGDNRGAVANKLQSKLKEAQGSRTT